MTMHPTLWDFTHSPCAQPQTRPTLQISFLTALHRRIIWSSSQLSVRRRPSLRSSSVSDRNHTPLSGAFSQVCKLENVSHSCNYQQLDLIDPLGIHYKLPFWSRNIIPHIILHDGLILFCHGILPYLLTCCFSMTRRLGINDVVHG
jgi:hypothetical protein